MEFDVDRLARLVDERAVSPAALERLGAAVSVVEDLRAHGDQLLDRFVAQARNDGCSWTEIGETLGISKQAAHQRFVATEQRPAVWPAHATELVRAAMVTAQHESRQMGHNHLGTEHLLLGLLAETDGVAAHALAALGVDRVCVVARIDERIGTAPDRWWDALCVAPRVKRALELARSHARALGHRCMNTEHVLLGLVDVGDSMAAEILGDLGATPDAVRDQLAGMLGVEPGQLRPRSRRRRLRRAAVR
jgi:hypothetical protein